ncbi:hypothetical protein SOVF_150470 [Spinacia oleracea]|uniref:Protein DETOXIFICATION n=1 Tax=Spinacia oleracea TaxID=3562 RepID=A0A9R0IAS1_SPIOL|nr:protein DETOXIFICATION 27-like [Spinacia oleracea]KNA09774.1 hypothetical protein SOVF_150470 [Spinacia oleracea]
MVEADQKVPLLLEKNNGSSIVVNPRQNDYYFEDELLSKRVWVESKKLWHIVGPTIVTRIAAYTLFIIAQSFAGHIGDIELAAVSLGSNVILGLTCGLLVGMASALETLCGQAYGAKKYYMLGVYMQRSWIVLFTCSILLLPLFICTTHILKLLGQPNHVADLAGTVAIWLIPLHLCFPFLFPLQTFLQSQLQPGIMAWVSLVGVVFQIIGSWLLISVFGWGVKGVAVALSLAWWIQALILFGYIVWWGGCPLCWDGFSMEAFSGLWEFVKLSAASGVMICLEYWYSTALMLMTGNLKNADIALDALSICTSINQWEIMIPFAFFAGVGVRVANELGAGNGKGARFATIVASSTSLAIGIVFWLLVMVFHDKLALIFSNSQPVLDEVNKLSILLAFTILLNSLQPVLSGVAVGSGWQSIVAYVNIGSYYFIGIPLGLLLGWKLHGGVTGIWGGMIMGTGVQTAILGIITMRCNWEKEAHKASTHIDKWETI